MDEILLCGPPGVVKFSVARVLTNRTKFKLFQYHLTVALLDPVSTAFAGTMNKMQDFFRQLCHSPISRGAAVMLVGLAWNSSAFCGEIHLAATNGDLERVKSLLKEHPGLAFSKDDNGETPLHWAAGNGHTEVAALLLASHAEVNAKDNGGDTPLHEASGKGFSDTVRLLLTNHADVNLKDNHGYTPLHYAALGHQMEAAGLLLANHAEVNAKDNKGRTPLHWAVAKGYQDVAELLRERGGHP